MMQTTLEQPTGPEPGVRNAGTAGTAIAARPVVRVERLCKRYKRQVAVQDVSLSVQAGEIYGIIGPDAAGKSSLMKAIAGVLSFQSGSVEVFGTVLSSEARAETVKGRLGLMPQGLGLNLYPDLSVEENIDFFARLRLVPEIALAERKRRLLAMTRLEPFRQRAMRNLSGGMKQKLGLICTLIHEPDLIILDEPTTGVDPVSRRDFWAILAELQAERGMTAIVSTAYLDEASRFHRLSLMYGGRIMAEGTPADISSSILGTVVSLHTADQPAALQGLQSRFAQVEAVGQGIRVLVEAGDPAIAERQVRDALAGTAIDSMACARPELEDVFVALLRRQGAVQPTDATAPVDWSAAGRASSDHSAIEARDLTQEFGAFRAVDRVSFKVEHGEIFGLLGANGAGKTTVIKMLTGILPPTSGNGHIAGKDVHLGRTEIKRRIGYVSQAFSLYQDLTAIENIRLYAGIYGLSRAEVRARTAWIVRMAGLEGHANALSGSLPMGLRQRLALGCALVHQPQVLFLDEPTSGVDPVGRRGFWDILFHLSRNEGVTILVTTHYMSEAEHCDHLALMYAGRIVADASPVEMKRQVEQEAGSLLEVEVDRPAACMKQLEKAGFREPSLFGQRIHLLSARPEADSERIRRVLDESGFHTSSVQRCPLSMEDVFVYRVRQLEEQASPESAGRDA